MKQRNVLLPLALTGLLLAAFHATPLLGTADDPPSVPARPGDLGTGWSEPEPLPGATPAQPEALAGTEASFTDWWKIVFQSYRNYNWEICLTSGNGGSLTRLTNNSVPDIHPRLNRGCTKIAFASKRDGDYEIWTMNLDGSGLTMLTSNASDDVMPAWSYDGTRIAFQAYRDGQAEVYVMNADGSNQVRLTYNAAYDGEPSWSPDGSQIAFTSNRSGGYGIWTMNADGSNPVQRAAQPVSENPSWASGGQWIAYDADLDGDGFQELMRMGPDGTGHTLLHNPISLYTDDWARSSSPDSAYIGLTKVEWILYQGQWYWKTAYLYAIDWQGNSLTKLSTDGVDWGPDWQSADILPPNSSVTALPATSPSPFPLYWSGTDSEGSGIVSYDVQVRDGADGAWTDWQLWTQSTSASYSGQGGHTYYFRCRARDVAGNIEDWPAGHDTLTTVEALAPVTAVASLPQFSPRNFRVRWGGTDPGGSGISDYDVEYRLGALGDWTGWRWSTPDTSAVMRDASPGATYCFRSRGTDQAGNVEGWPPGDGDACTTVYSSYLAGTVSDNASAPVGDAIVTVTPDPLATYPSDREGAYSAYIGLDGDSYDVAWAKAGYGELPTTTLDARQDASFDAVLPPADNVVADWGFESGNLLPHWLPGGTYPPAAGTEARHTGSYGAALGLPLTWQPAFMVVASQANLMNGAFAVDGTGTASVLWTDVDLGALLYRQRRPDGSWSVVETVFTFPDLPSEGRMAVDASGIRHVVWRNLSDESVYYSSRSGGGAWSTPLNLSTSYDTRGVPELVITPDGAVNVVWMDAGASQLLYTRRNPDGSWSVPRNITGQHKLQEWCLAAGDDGSVHVVYNSDSNVYHTRRGVGGGWSDEVGLISGWAWTHKPDLTVDGLGNAHVTWTEQAGGRLMYRSRSQAGAWSSPVDLSGVIGASFYTDLAATPQGTVHALWYDSSGQVYHAWRKETGPWSDPATVGSDEQIVTEPTPDVRLAVDPEGTVYAAWGCEEAGDNILRVARWEGSGWSDPVDVWDGTPEGGMGPRIWLAADALGGAHVVWQFIGPYALLYAGTNPVEQAGDSLISKVVTVPAGVPPRLSFLYRLSGASANWGTGFRLLLDDGNDPVELLSTHANTAGWEQASFDLGPWAGQTITLTFGVDEAAGAAPLQLGLDEVTLGRAYPGLWVSKSGPFSAEPGAQTVFTLNYGNRGGAPAAAVMLTDTLPAGLTFESADPPPSSVEPFLTWQVGELAAGSGPFTILLHTRAAPDLAPGTTLVNEVEIGSPSAELEMVDNQAQARLWIGYRILLPVVNRAY